MNEDLLRKALAALGPAASDDPVLVAEVRTTLQAELDAPAMWVLTMFKPQGPHGTKRPEAVARAPTLSALVNFVERERFLVSYVENGITKYFRPGPLEDCAVPSKVFPEGYVHRVGTRLDWAEKAASNYDRDVTALPEVPSS